MKAFTEDITDDDNIEIYGSFYTSSNRGAAISDGLAAA